MSSVIVGMDNQCGARDAVEFIRHEQFFLAKNDLLSKEDLSFMADIARKFKFHGDVFVNVGNNLEKQSVLVIKAYCTDCELNKNTEVPYFTINKERWNELEIDQRRFIFAREMAHYIMKHCDYRHRILLLQLRGTSLNKNSLFREVELSGGPSLDNRSYQKMAYEADIIAAQTIGNAEGAISYYLYRTQMNVPLDNYLYAPTKLLEKIQVIKEVFYADIMGNSTQPSTWGRIRYLLKWQQENRARL